MPRPAGQPLERPRGIAARAAAGRRRPQGMHPRLCEGNGEFPLVSEGTASPPTPWGLAQLARRNLSRPGIPSDNKCPQRFRGFFY